MSRSLQSTYPSCLWAHFYQLLKIPRPSKHEDQVRDYILNWAAENAYEVRIDDAGNLVVVVPERCASKDPVIILQAHLDMVGEKEEDAVFDFLTDPIQTEVRGNFLCSVGTTLGADNGIGVASALAIAEDETIEHGVLELLFTVDEETGLTGAKDLDASILTGDLLINLDSEDDSIYIGCAGALDSQMRFQVEFGNDLKLSIPLRLSVGELQGGHSGVTIHRNAGNAIKILARVMNSLRKKGLEFGIVSWNGGGGRNAIPRDSSAIIRVERGAEERISEVVKSHLMRLREEFREIDPELVIEVSRVADLPSEESVWSVDDRDRILDCILACPHGVMALSRVVPGLVETSNNLASISTRDSIVEISTLTRSAVGDSLETVSDELKSLFCLAGAEVARLGGYPSWTPNTNSMLLRTAMGVYQDLKGCAPVVRAVHAGLECGIIGGKRPGLDMISIGPVIEGAHTPHERVEIRSVGFFYRFLKGIVKELARGTGKEKVLRV